MSMFAAMNWHEFFSYDAETGNLIWKERPLSHFKNERAFVQWHATWLGKVVGNRRYKPDGRKAGIYTTLYGKSYAAHRIILAMHGIEIPDGHVPDHIDGDQFNNRLSNLRVATHAENGWNKKLASRNKLRLKGVYENGFGSFASQIQVNGKVIYLGTFPTKGLAALTRAKAAFRHHGKFARVG